MSKKTAIIIIILVLLLVSGGLLVFYFYTKNNNKVDSNQNQNPKIENPFPGVENPRPETNIGTSTPSQSETPTGNAFIPVLKELSTRPIAGATITASSSNIIVSFIEKGTGNVYNVSPQNDAEDRVTNTTIPKIEEAIWDKTGKKVIIRYAEDDSDNIKSYNAYIQDKNSDHPDGALGGNFMAENIKSITINPDKDKIFYLLQSSVGSNGIVADFDNAKRTQIFDSPLTEWLVDWPSSNIITITSKPSAGASGVMFMLNPKNGQLTKAISNINGLTTKTDLKGERAVYSESTSGGINFKIYSFKTGKVTDTPVSTFPEKCVWSKNNQEIIYCSVPSYIPQGLYPDSWYKGQVLFSDEIWKINTDTGSGELLLRLKDYAKKDIDGINLMLSPKEDYLMITNKIDYHIWSLRLGSN
jgi:hypothetical protein